MTGRSQHFCRTFGRCSRPARSRLPVYAESYRKPFSPRSRGIVDEDRKFVIGFVVTTRELYDGRTDPFFEFLAVGRQFPKVGSYLSRSPLVAYNIPNSKSK